MMTILDWSEHLNVALHAIQNIGRVSEPHLSLVRLLMLSILSRNLLLLMKTCQLWREHYLTLVIRQQIE